MAHNQTPPHSFKTKAKQQEDFRSVYPISLVSRTHR